MVCLKTAFALFENGDGSLKTAIVPFENGDRSLKTAFVPFHGRRTVITVITVMHGDYDRDGDDYRHNPPPVHTTATHHDVLRRTMTYYDVLRRTTTYYDEL